MTAVGQPIPAALTLARVSRLADFWTGEGFDMNTVGGLVGTMDRTTTSQVLASNNVYRDVNYAQPAWQAVDWDGDTVFDTHGLSLVTNARASWDFLGQPQAMTVYIEFQENGGKAIASAGVVYIGNTGNTGARFWIDSTGSFYRVRYHNGTSEVTSTLAAAPTTGQRVALRAVLDAANKVQIFQSINGAAETSGALSAALALPATWSNTLLYMNSTGLTNIGANIYVRRRIAWGVRTAAQMQALR